MTDSMATRAVAACDTVLWIAKLNAFWLAGTLAGGIVAGIGPSTLAAFAITRRYHRGEQTHAWTHYWSSYRSSFLRGNALCLPLVFVGIMLAANYRYFDASGEAAGHWARIAVLVLAAGFAAMVCVLLPMFTHYELPLLSYYAKASEFALRNIMLTILALFITAAIAFASLRLPGLLLFVSFGAWIHVDAYLCLKFFAANDAAVERARTAAQPALARRGA